MTDKKTDDDIGFDEDSNPIAVGDEARAKTDAIVDDPRAEPILIVAKLNGEIGVRVVGPPDSHTADILDHIARTYRLAVGAAKAPRQ